MLYMHNKTVEIHVCALSKHKSLYLFHIYPFTSDLTFDQHYTLQLLKDLLTVTLSKHLRIRLDKSASALCVNNSKKYLKEQNSVN